MSEETGIAYCPECGAKVQAPAKFCSQCGHMFASQESISENADKPDVVTTTTPEIQQDMLGVMNKIYQWPNWLKFVVTVAIASFLSIFIGRVSYVISFVLGFIFFKPKK